MHTFIVKFSSLINHNLFCLQLDSFTISIKAFRTVLAFLSVKDLTHAYLVKTPITHKNFIFLSLKDNDPISVKSAPEILPLNIG